MGKEVHKIFKIKNIIPGLWLGITCAQFTYHPHGLQSTFHDFFQVFLAIWGL